MGTQWFVYSRKNIDSITWTTWDTF